MDYTQEVIIGANQEKIFTAIAQNLEKWWGITDLAVTKIGDEFTTSFGPTFWKFRIAGFLPGKKITWKCIDAKHVHEGHGDIEKEWIGTTVYWTIEPEGNQAKVSVVHEGLTPDLNCYSVCEPAWDHFILDSLKSYAETGKGKPHLQ